MIERPTLLILGAGASRDYGVPLGRQLLLRAVNVLTSIPSTVQLLKDAGADEDELINFREELLWSMQPSIDAFLEHRGDYRDVGKLVIAAALTEYEKSGWFARQGDSQRWYEYLWQHIAAPPDKFGENKLKVLTFNYERSLEHFLFTALKNSYGLTPGQAMEALGAIEIVHLYGQLGKYLGNHADGEGRPYDVEPPDAADIKVAAAGIRILHEGVADAEGAAVASSEFSRAHELLAESEVVCLLGIGFHPVNMNRLAIGDHVSPSCRVFASAFGLTPAELDLAITLIGLVGRSPTTGSDQQDVLTFLRNHRILW